MKNVYAMFIVCSRALVQVRTGDDVEFLDVGYLGAVAEGLAADSGVGEGATDGEVEVVGPRPRGEAVREGGMQHVHPELFASRVDVAALDGDGEAGGRAAGEPPERRHIHYDAPGRGCLAADRMTAASGGHRERGGASARRVQKSGDVVGARRIKHGRWHDHVYRHVAEVGGCARGGLGVVADQRADAEVAELVGEG
jgi:hypothetical protein